MKIGVAVSVSDDGKNVVRNSDFVLVTQQKILKLHFLLKIVPILNWKHIKAREKSRLNEFHWFLCSDSVKKVKFFLAQ